MRRRCGYGTSAIRADRNSRSGSDRLYRLLDLRPRLLDERPVLNARRTGRHAGHTAEAPVEVLHEGRRHLRPALDGSFHQIDLGREVSPFPRPTARRSDTSAGKTRNGRTCRSARTAGRLGSWNAGVGLMGSGFNRFNGFRRSCSGFTAGQIGPRFAFRTPAGIEHFSRPGRRDRTTARAPTRPRALSARAIRAAERRCQRLALARRRPTAATSAAIPPDRRAVPAPRTRPANRHADSVAALQLPEQCQHLRQPRRQPAESHRRVALCQARPVAPPMSRLRRRRSAPSAWPDTSARAAAIWASRAAGLVAIRSFNWNGVSPSSARRSKAAGSI